MLILKKLLTKMLVGIQTAQTTANSAQTTANTAQTTANSAAKVHVQSQSVTGNLAKLATSGTFSAFGYMSITRPSGVPWNAAPILGASGAQAWAVKMSDGNARILSTSTSGSITVTIWWIWRAS